MKKIYKAPSISIVEAPELLQVTVQSIGLSGGGTGIPDWGNGGDATPDDPVDSKKFNLWDDWEDE